MTDAALRPASARKILWRVATLAEVRAETPTAHTLVLDVPGWTGHLPGQHLDVRLTAEDGYSTQRSYSIATPTDPAAPERLELTVQRVEDGEVSPYLLDGFVVGGPLEVRGPVGRWFVWRQQDPAPVLLVAGGSGIVPLMAMVRARVRAGLRTPFRLVYSVRSPDEVYYRDELRRLPGGIDVQVLYTRTAPDGDRRGAKRIGLPDVTTHGWPPDFEPSCFVCGPTGFVEAVADMLVALGHDPGRVHTERFGPTGA